MPQLGFTFTVSQPPSQEAVDVNSDRVKRMIFEHQRVLARRMGEAYQNNLKIAIVNVRAIATGSTLRSVKDEMLLESPSRALIQRRTTALKSIFWIEKGRPPGKAPLKFMGTRSGKRGKPVKWFEPVAGLVEWFLALNIRRALWIPIAIKIGKRGVRARPVQMRAVRASDTAWTNAMKTFAERVIVDIFRR